MTSSAKSQFLSKSPSAPSTSAGITITPISQKEGFSTWIDIDTQASIDSIQQAKLWATSAVGDVLANEDNWDGYNAETPKYEAALASVYILAVFKFQYRNLVVPEVEPVRDGGISLIWEQGELTLQIEVSSSDCMSYLFKNGINDHYSGSRFYADSLPSRLKIALSLLSPA